MTDDRLICCGPQGCGEVLPGGLSYNSYLPDDGPGMHYAPNERVVFAYSIVAALNAPRYCIKEKCTAWRTVEEIGYCGLAGKP